jgi:hypothetical protein
MDGSRWVWRAGVVVVLAGGAGLAGCEPTAGNAGSGSVDAQAVAASKDFAARYVAVMGEGQPAAGANAAELVSAAAARIEEASRAAMDEAAAGVQGLDARNVGLGEVAEASVSAAHRAVARAGVEAALRGGAAELTAEVARAPRWMVEPDGVLLLKTNLPQLGHARQVARFQRGRMVLARERGDVEEWVRAFGETMRLGEQVSRTPILIGALVGVAVHAVALGQARELVNSGKADEATLARVEEIIRETSLASIERALKGEQVAGEDALDYVYRGGPGAMKALGELGAGGGGVPARGNALLVPDDRAMGPGMPARPAHITLLVREYRVAMAIARATIAERPRIRREMPAPGEGESLLAGMLIPAIDRAVGAWDQGRADTIGTRVIVALERYRLANGRYPETLAALVPAYLAEAPMDPGSGLGVGYRAPSGGPYEGGRAYVVYTTGSDGVDNGGAVKFADPFGSTRVGAEPGADFPINREVSAAP